MGIDWIVTLWPALVVLVANTVHGFSGLAQRPLRRVATLLIEADRHIAGQLDGSTGQVETTDIGDSQIDDLLDDLGELKRPESIQRSRHTLGSPPERG